MFLVDENLVSAIAFDINMSHSTEVTLGWYLNSHDLEQIPKNDDDRLHSNFIFPTVHKHLT